MPARTAKMYGGRLARRSTEFQINQRGSVGKREWETVKLARKSNKKQADDHSAAGSVRIIGGELRGRRLAYTADPRTRPMKDRVREAVFNLLGEVQGLVAIDLFAGTGALGFEALSRGARSVIFFEQHFPTADVIRKNATSLGLDGRCQVIAADTLVWLRREIRLPNMPLDSPWLIFCSPPYDLFVSGKEALLHVLSGLWNKAPPHSRFAVEADERFDFADLPEPENWRVRSYPPAHVGLAWKEHD